MSGPRKGWREKVEPGLYRAHRVACPSSTDLKSERRCRCPFHLAAPGHGGSRLVTFEGTVTEARTERRRLLAAGLPEAPETETKAGNLDDFAASYFRAKAAVLSSETIRNRDDDYRLRIGPNLGHLELTDLTRERIEVWLAALITAASSRRMIVQTVATLRVILATAVGWGRLADNPAAKLTIPAHETNAEQAVERVLDAETMSRLFAAAGTLRTETMLRAAGETGLRRGEIAGLRWPDVDLAARRLDVRRSIVQERARDGAPMRKVEKTPKGRRSRRVAISASFAARLADWYAESVVTGGADATGCVWPGKDGGPMHDRSLARALERACDRAGLVANPDRGEGERVIPMVTPHGLRHSCASIMLSRGVPLIVVSRQLGHANPNITATIYAHLLGDSELDRAAEVFEQASTDAALPDELVGEGTEAETRMDTAITRDPDAAL